MLKKINIYCDGACLSNPGAGGYCSILTYNDREKIISGGAVQTTNNRMELLGVINGIEALAEQCEITVYTDSKYVVDGIEKGWAENWRKNNWIKPSDKKPALNADLWEQLLDAISGHTVKFIWIKGHNGHEYNERCDKIARETALEHQNRKI